MGTISTNEFRKKVTILMDGQPWIIIDNEFVKPGKGQAFNKVKLKNLITGRVLERNFKSGETVEETEVSKAVMQYLFNDGAGNYTFMNIKDFEQTEIPKDKIGDDVRWLLESTECEVSMWNNMVIAITPPTFMEFTITYAEPTVKGEPTNNLTKKATLETGYDIDVPMFVSAGDKVKMDTRTGEYLGRV